MENVIKVNQSLHEEFFAHIQIRGYSQNFVATQLGYTGATISGYKNKSYTGDIEKLEAQIKRWLEDERRRDEMLAIPILRLTTVTNIQIAIDAAKNRRNISIITGDAGIGKSEGVKFYANNSSQALYVEVGPLRSRKSLLREIAKKIDIMPKGSADMIIEMIVDKMKDTGKVLIIDEADRLDFEKLDMLRRISDLTRCGLVLVAVPKFEGEISNKIADYGQLSSRVGLCLRLNEIKDDNLVTNIKLILDATKFNYDNDAFSLLLKKCNKSLRKLCDTLISCYELMRKYNVEILSGEIVTDALSMKL